MGSTMFTNTLSYTYGLPVLYDVSPTVFPTDGGTTLKLVGENFGVDLNQLYMHRLREHGPTETVAAANSWRPNQVFLVQNSILSNCTVTLVRPTCVFAGARVVPSKCCDVLMWYFTRCLICLLVAVVEREDRVHDARGCRNGLFHRHSRVTDVQDSWLHV